MKNKNLKIAYPLVAFLFFGMVTACNEKGKNTDNESESGELRDASTAINFENEPAFLIEYMNLKDALVADDKNKVSKAANNFQSNLVNESEISQEQLEVLAQIADQISGAESLETQREYFAVLSETLFTIMQKNDLADQTLYWQNCPMAMNNQGANWLSFQEQINNPYMGQSMPRCGTTKERIN